MDRKEYRDFLYAKYNQVSDNRCKKKSHLSKHLFSKEIIKRHFPKDKEAIILDLGCGQGLFLKVLEQKGYLSCLGVDCSKSQVERAQCADVRQIIQGDVLTYLHGLASSSVDVITSFDLLEHLSKTEVVEMAREIFRVLSRDGIWIVHTVNAESPFFGRVLYGDYTHEQAFTKRSILQLALAFGFTKVSCYEDKPIVHGIKSFFRRILWSGARFVFRAIHSIETGEIDGIFSQNFLAVIYK
jgi:2-polyprenyl-3-methyl-5-hydroxy-6-metoxy-1,4-benzoquinol methylase